MYKLLDYLDNIDIDIPKIKTHNLKNFYNYIVNLYKSINKKNIKINSNVTEVNLTKHTNINKETENSKELINFLENSNVLKIINYCYYNNKLNLLLDKYDTPDIDFVKELLEKQNYNGLIIFLNKNGKIMFNNINSLIVNNYLPNNIYIHDNDIYNSFISLTNLLSIESMSYLHSYIIKYESFTINLKIYNKRKKFSKKKLDKIIHLIILMCLFKKKNNLTINIDIYATNNKKLLPYYYKNIGNNEINSALNISYKNDKNNNKIIIFRLEELNKVLIHELVHNLELDLVNHLSYKLDKYFDINNKILINEVYIEILSSLINCIIFSYDYNKKKDYALLKEILEYELKFSYYQSAKILVHFGYKDINLFFKKNHSNLFLQSSAAFEYYILKTSLLSNLDYILEIFNNNYNQYFLIDNHIEFNKLFVNLVLKCSNEKMFINNLNKFFKYIRKNKSPPLLYNNLRMVIFS